MGRIGINVGESLGKEWREVLVEEELHRGGMDRSFLSLSAANARQAQISSAVRSGKSANNLLLGHSGCQIIQDVRNGDAESPNAGLAASFP